jgi:CheY-like chemotaxis protein
LVTGRKLLLADDSVTIQKVINLTFSDEGIEVTTVGNGELAISKLDELQPDIVLADVFMPGRSGYEVCEHIKRDERFRHIPVLLLVGSFEPFDEAEARRVGADDYLTKPFQSIRQLVSKVTSLLSGESGAQKQDEATTQDLNMPEELAEKERGGSQPGGAEDIHTIDTAPLPKELADKEPAEAAARLAGHESLDDEMIEARAASEVEGPRATLGDTTTRPTAPFSAADLEEAGIKPSASTPPASTSPASPAPEPFQVQETIRDFRFDEMNEDAIQAKAQQGQQSPAARYMNNAAAADEALLDLGDIEPPVSTIEADDFILDLQDDSPSAPVAQPTPAVASSEAAQLEPEAAGVSDGFAFSPAVVEQPRGEFGDWVAPSEPEAVQAAAPYAAEGPEALSQEAEEEPAVMESAPFEDAGPHVYEPQVASYGLSEASAVPMRETMIPETPTGYDEQPAVAGSAVEEAPATGQISLDRLSPEAIDAIARRAVELLSSKVVEEIAWEVVPQLAELLIKRKLEEEKMQ